MADVNVPTKCVVPITTPLLTGASVAEPNANGEVGKLTWPWIMFFNCLAKKQAAAGEVRIAFNICIDDPPTVPQELDYKDIWTWQAAGQAIAVFAIATEPPIGSEMEFDFFLNGASIFGSEKLVIPNGTGSVVTFSTFAQSPLQAVEGDIITGRVLKVGSVFSGQHVTVFITFRLIAER